MNGARIGIVLLSLATVWGQSHASEPLKLETTIPMSNVQGRIDHGTPTHGKASMVHHTGTGIFVGVANPFEAGRYHSLVVARDAVPGELEITAWTNRWPSPPATSAT